MQQAAAVDEAHIAAEQQAVTQLRLENKTLRELLRISTMNQAHDYQIVKVESETQTVSHDTYSTTEEETDDDADLSAIWNDGQDPNSTIIRAPKKSTGGEGKQGPNEGARDSESQDDGSDLASDEEATTPQETDKSPPK